MNKQVLLTRKEQILRDNCHFYNNFTSKDQRWFNEILERFLTEAEFVGHGLEITDEIKITIGAWAARIILKLPFGSYYYSHIDVINVHSGYILPSGALGQMRDGYFYCYIDLAWDEVLQSIHNKKSTSSTIIHEFAHALDQKDRLVNGVPSQIIPFDLIDEWKSIFNSKYFIEHPKVNKIWQYFELSNWEEFKIGDQSCINLSEIFSVASEKYFEDAKNLQKILPEVYDQLNNLFKQDTATSNNLVLRDFIRKLMDKVSQFKR